MKTSSIIACVVASVALGAPALAQCTASCGSGACPALPYDGPTACAPPAPAACPVGPVTFVDQATFTWPAAPDACAPLLYDVAVGDLACLKGSCEVTLACPACMALEEDGTDTMAIDTTPLAIGEGRFYVVRVDAQSWNSTGPGQCSDYDPALAGTCH